MNQSVVQCAHIQIKVNKGGWKAAKKSYCLYP